MDFDTAFVQAALDRQLFSPDEAHQALAQARTARRPVSELLVEQGLLAPRTVAALQADLAKKSGPPASGAGPVDAPTLALPSGPGVGAAPVLVAGEFELHEKLGEGGMGAVYRAVQRSLQRPVALKVLAANYAASPDAAARFVREARAAAAVSHPNVITVFHVGQERGRLFMVMELVTGGDADQLARKHGGRLPERRALEVVRDAAQGLVAIERAGLVHRDIKPSNIFITEDGAAKLADLGLARQQTGDDRMTQSGMIVGTPAFMSPEQANAQPVDVRTDIYALGATLFQLLSGRAPYEGPSSLAVVAKVINDPVPDVRKVAPGVSRATADVVTRAMAKSPADRYADAQAFLQALRDALAAPPESKTGVVPPPSSAALDLAAEPAPRTPPSTASSGRTPARAASGRLAASGGGRTSGRAAALRATPGAKTAADAEARAGRIAAAAIAAALVLLLGVGAGLLASGSPDEPLATATDATEPRPDAPPPVTTTPRGPTPTPTPLATEAAVRTTEAPPVPEVTPTTHAVATEAPDVTPTTPPVATEETPPSSDLPPSGDLPPSNDHPPSNDLPPSGDLPPSSDLPPSNDLPPLDDHPPDQGPGRPGPEPGRQPQGGAFGGPLDRGLLPLIEDILRHEVGPLEFTVLPAGAGDRVAGGAYLVDPRGSMRLQTSAAHPVPCGVIWVLRDAAPLIARGRTEVSLALRSGNDVVSSADGLRDERGVVVHLVLDGTSLEVRAQGLGAADEEVRSPALEVDARQVLAVGMRADDDAWTVAVLQRGDRAPLRRRKGPGGPPPGGRRPPPPPPPNGPPPTGRDGRRPEPPNDDRPDGRRPDGRSPDDRTPGDRTPGDRSTDDRSGEGGPDEREGALPPPLWVYTRPWSSESAPRGELHPWASVEAKSKDRPAITAYARALR